MNIMITGTQFANKGAQSLLFSIMNEFRKRDPNVKIYYVPMDGEKQYRGSPYRFTAVSGSRAAVAYDRNPKERTKLLLKATAKKALGRADEDITALHKAFSDIDVMIDASGYQLGSKWPIYSNERFLGYIESAKACGAKVILTPQSFGPFDYGDKQAEMDQKIRSALGKADLIFAREQEGLDLLTEKYGIKNVRLSLDLVLQASEIDWRNVTTEEPKIDVPAVEPGSVGVIPNAETEKRYGKDFVLSVYRAMIDRLLASGRKVCVFRHSADLDLCKEIYAMYRGNGDVTLIEDDFSCFAYSAFVRQFDFIIASRFHAIVHAYKEGVPALVLGWAIKYQELTKRFGQDAFVFDFGQLRDDAGREAALAALETLGGSVAEQSALIKEKRADLLRHTCFDDCFALLGMD